MMFIPMHARSRLERWLLICVGLVAYVVAGDVVRGLRRVRRES